MADNYDPWANFNPLPQAQNEQQNWMNNYSAGNNNNSAGGLNPNGGQEINNWMNQASNYGFGSGPGNQQSGMGSQPRYNTDQGMNKDPWGGWDANTLAGNGNNPSGQSYLGNPTESNRGLQMIGGWKGISPNLPTPATAAPYGQQPLFDYNDRAQQDAFVKSLGANAPAAFLDNGNMGNGGWDARYNALRQAAMGRPLSDFGPAAGPQGGAVNGGELDYAHPENIDWHQFRDNVYGAAGANRQFNELAGVLSPQSEALNSAKYGWQLATPNGTSDQAKALQLAYIMGRQNPNTDYSVVQTPDGYNIASRSKSYTAPLPPPSSQRYAGAGAGGYSGGGGGNGGGYHTSLPPTRGGQGGVQQYSQPIGPEQIMRNKTTGQYGNLLPNGKTIVPMSWIDVVTGKANMNRGGMPIAPNIPLPGPGASIEKKLATGAANPILNALNQAGYNAQNPPYVPTPYTPAPLSDWVSQQHGLPQQGTIVPMGGGTYGVIDGNGNVQSISNEPSY